MAGKEEMRIFVGGLSWDTTDRQLEDAFSRYGKILEAQLDFWKGYLFKWVQWNEMITYIGFSLLRFSSWVAFAEKRT